MITSKAFWENEEIVLFDKGSGIWTFYRKSNIPENNPWKVIEDPENYMLRMIAVRSGTEVTKKYYVTPPDKLEWWMGTYTYLPSGECIHCDPIMYGNDDADAYDPENDISDTTMDVALHCEGIIPTKDENGKKRIIN